MTCKEEPGLDLEDGAERIFLNTRGANPEEVSPELVELLHYMENTNTAAPAESQKVREIQKRVEEAGLEIVEARITYLAYAPEIAAVMLQRQQASAVIDARKMIVDGAVGMVEMALERLDEKHTVELDDERKAAMVSNLLVVLCGNHDAQPVVNSGSLY